MSHLAGLALALVAPSVSSTQLTNLGIATVPQLPGGAHGDVVAWVGSEFAHGSDLDGDGGQLDVVLFVRRASTGFTRNTQLSLGDSDSLHVSDRLCVAAVRESQTGGAGGQILNADGDRLDLVVSVYDSQADVIRNLALAAGPDSGGALVAVARGPHVLFGVSEASQGGDRNGDGDVFDTVAHYWNADTQQSTSLGLALHGLASEKLVAGPRHALFLVSEAGQRVDLNGDGDMADAVVHHLAFATGLVTNVGLAARTIRGDGDLFGIHVEEEAQGATDLDGDGDLNDSVLYAYLAPTATLRRLAPSLHVMSAGAQFDVQGFVLAWASPESTAGSGTDWNGNGFTNNVVLCTHQARSAATRNSGLAIPADFTEAYRFAISGSLVMASLDEGAQSGTDWNGDGLANDDVTVLFDATTGAVRNLDLAAYYRMPDFTDWPTAWIATRGYFAFCVDELGESQDLNGDGRIAPALAVHRIASGTTTILPASPTIPLQACCVEDRVVYLADESASLPAADRNGDGDTLDDVLTSWSASTGVATNHAIAVRATTSVFERHYRSRAALVPVVEALQGQQDLNGDGNVQDDVAHVLEP